MKRVLLIFLWTALTFVSALAQYQNLNLSASFDTLSPASFNSRGVSLDIVAKKIRPFTVNPSVLNSDHLKIGDTLTLNLFKEKVYASTIITKTKDVNGVVTIVLQLTKFYYSYCFISISEGKILLSVDIPELNEFYTTRYPAVNNLYLIQMDENEKNQLEEATTLTPANSKDRPIEKFQEDSKKNKGKYPLYGTKNSTPCLNPSDFARINIG